MPNRVHIGTCREDDFKVKIYSLPNGCYMAQLYFRDALDSTLENLSRDAVKKLFGDWEDYTKIKL